MRPIVLLLSLTLAAAAQPTSEEYALGPDSHRQPGVPRGAVTQHTWTSTLYPGAVRDYWIYIPAQLDRNQPAPFMVFQDGQNMVREDGPFRVPVVLDNLIHKKDLPPLVGVFVSPGVLPARNNQEQARYNRSFEYDSMSDLYARFLVTELLPAVNERVKLSADPNARAIGGSSSGGIAAFNAAWRRPDQFRRVLSFIGSYTNLRGGHLVPTIIRKTEPKPLRIFLQDGRNDNDIYAGSWWIANQDVAAALAYAGYDHRFVTGNEGHNSKHGAAILPDALRWLWRDYPQPIAKPRQTRDRHYLASALDPAQDWELVGEGYRFTEGPAVDRQGNVFFTDIPNNRIHKIGLDGKVTVFKENSGGANGLMFGPDGRLYACQNGRKRIVAYTMDGAEHAIAEGVQSNDLVINHAGDIWFTDPPGRRIWHIDPKGARKVVHEGGRIEFPNGILLSPDQSLLTVADSRGKFVWSWQVQPDGSLRHMQPFYRLETPEEFAAGSGADGMTMDTEGHLYVATPIGVQVCDQPGRVVAILNNPHLGALSNVAFGGPDLDTLYVTAGDKVFRRRIRRKGVTPWIVVKPPQPRL